MSILKAENYTGFERWRSTSPWDRNKMERGGLRTLLVGGGAAARTLAKDLRRSPDYGLRLVGCLDDDLHLRSVASIPVLGRLADLTRIVDERDVEAIVIAIPSLHPARLSELVRQATNTGAHVRFLPSFLSALERAARAADMRIVGFQQPARPSGASWIAADCKSRLQGGARPGDRCGRLDRSRALSPNPQLLPRVAPHVGPRRIEFAHLAARARR